MLKRHPAPRHPCSLLRIVAWAVIIFIAAAFWIGGPALIIWMSH